MNIILLLALWAASLTGWGNVAYLHMCGATGKKPNYGVIIKSLIAAIISLALGTICHSLLQAALASYMRY